MRRHFLIVLLLISGNIAKGQDTTRTQRDKKIQVLLKMSSDQYQTYSQNIKQYDKRLNQILKDTTLDRNEKGVAMKQVLIERSSYHERQLTEAQRKALLDYNRQNSPSMLRVKQQRKLQERLRKRGIKAVIKDSIH